MGEPKTIPSISIESQAIIRLMEKATIGETITYEAMSEAIGRDIRAQAYFALQTARNRLLRDHQMVFETVRDVGVKRLSDSEKVEVGESYLEKVHRLAHRGLVKITAVDDFNSLTPEAKIKHNGITTLLYFTKKVSGKKGVERIQSAVSEASGALPLQKTLDAFRNGEEK